MALLAPWQGEIKGIPQGAKVWDEVKESYMVRYGNRRIEIETLESAHSWNRDISRKTGKVDNGNSVV